MNILGLYNDCLLYAAQADWPMRWQRLRGRRGRPESPCGCCCQQATHKPTLDGSINDQVSVYATEGSPQWLANFCELLACAAQDPHNMPSPAISVPLRVPRRAYHPASSRIDCALIQGSSGWGRAHMLIIMGTPGKMILFEQLARGNSSFSTMESSTMEYSSKFRVT